MSLQVGGSVDPEVILARAFLSRVAEPASAVVWGFVDQVGPVQAASAIRAGSAPAPVVSLTRARRDHVDPEGDLDTAERHGIRLVVPESEHWPQFALSALERVARATDARCEARASVPAGRDGGDPVPPLALWVKGSGDLLAVGVRSVAIVGARAATAYGEHVTAELAYGLAQREVLVVSGGAYGIDASAHRSALAAGRPTMVVCAGGLDRPYPAGNASLFERAADGGLLVSESPPGSTPQRHRFLTRNRLIAAFSTGTLVVEAAARSGAANTAAHATRMGRPVMAVPGPITSAMSAGCHALLARDHDRALLVTSVDDVIAVVGSMGEGILAKRVVGPTDARAELDALDPVARRVFDGLSVRRPARPEEIAQRSGLSPLEVIRALPGLDLAGLLETCEGGYRIAARLRRDARR
ncbi:MAG: DNA-processing protein DprA [Actinomycetota bacterium]|nr:DNA-processing protein DprA [Actinomycetota bacterium]